MSGKRTWMTLALLGLLTSGGTLLAQEEVDAAEDTEGKKVIYKKETEINFEGLDVQGEIKKPTGAYLLERKKSRFSPLIKFRQNWDDEVVRSLDEKK